MILGILFFGNRTTTIIGNMMFQPITRRHVLYAICMAGLLPLLFLLTACGGGGGGGGTAPPPACGSGTTPAPGLVVTEFGAVQGAASGGTYRFLGIPYAAPPTGTLRWQPPQDPGCWDNPRSTTAFTAGCIQKRFDQFSDTYSIEGSEDCLYLNVWTPANYGGASKPVMVFIHGGGNQQGSASQVTAGAVLYDGEKLAERGDVVVVTIDYRLGPLGFLAHPSLTDSGGHYGNWGLLDQIKALHWVQHNITQFGGDPGRVLMFGESGGAVDTCMLLVSPQASGLFSRAAMESGACNAKTLAVREQDQTGYLSDLGCDGVPDTKACLLALSASALVTPESKPFSGGVVTQTFGPGIDGWILPQDPLLALEQGDFNHVALMIGSNSDETSIGAVPNTITRAMVLALFAAVPEPMRSALLAIYDPGSGVPLTDPSPEARDSFIRATTDGQFNCNARRALRRAVQAPGQTAPLYRYYFSHRLAGTFGDAYGAYHGFELFYVFQTIEDSSYQPILNSDDAIVTQQVLGYWTRFAATGNPNDPSAVAWPAYSSSDPYLNLSATPTAGSGLLTEACDQWDLVAAQ